MNPILNQTAPNGDQDDLDNEPDNDTGLPDEDNGDASDRGKNDHHQDDNYALGGHVTRSSE